MRTYRYLHLDVFTDSPFEGNQLAVFPEPAGLTTEEMQTITREMNFSECTFIFPPEASGTTCECGSSRRAKNCQWRDTRRLGARSRSPRKGSSSRVRPASSSGSVSGPTPVSLEWKGNALDFAWMTQKNPQFGGEIKDRAGFARALGLAAGDLEAPVPQVGVLRRTVPVRGAGHAHSGRPSVASIQLHTRRPAAPRASRSYPSLSSPPTAAGRPDDEVVYSRMLAPGFGIAEDPATGGASGPLGCYLFRYGMVPRERLSHFVSLQGVKMKRPSRIHISIDATGDEITRVRVGGRSVTVGDGRLTF